MKKVIIPAIILSSVGVGAAVAARPNMTTGLTARPSLHMPVTNVTSGGGIINNVSATAIATDARCARILPAERTQTQCIQRYMGCLRQDNVCGEHFESCDTTNRFNGRKIFCADRLLECPDEAITAIFGQTVTSARTTATCDGELVTVERRFTAPAGGVNALRHQSGSMIATAMADGAAWIAGNSVNACRNVADACIRRACQNSAFKCISADRLTEDNHEHMMTLINNEGAAMSTEATRFRVNPDLFHQYIQQMTWTASNVRNYLRGQCMTEIGGNRACFITVNGTTPPNDAWTTDVFEVESIYNDVMTGDLAMLSRNQPRIFEWLARNTFQAMDSCRETARNCVTQACGHGSLAMCFGQATSGGAAAQIQNQDFRGHCAGVINANQNCRDLFGEEGMTANQLWDRVWGTAGDDWSGSFNLVGQLNAELQAMFSEATVRATREQCRQFAEDCVRRECGNGFRDCYFNDTNLVARGMEGVGDLYGRVIFGNRGAGTIDMVANAAGGFDEGMAIRLCMIPVKRSQVCQTHFDIQFARTTDMGSLDSWGTAFDVRNMWAGGSNLSVQANTGLTCDVTRSYGALCGLNPENCNGEQLNCATREINIFRDLTADLGQEARAMLTREQNVLRNACDNQGNIWASRPRDLTAAQRSSFAQMGLQEVEETTDLWGAFCAVRADIVVNDPMLNTIFEGDRSVRTTTYFSMGDAFMCGSWIPQSTIDRMVEQIRQNAYEEQRRGQAVSDRGVRLISIFSGVAVGAAGGAIAGAALGDRIPFMQSATDGASSPYARDVRAHVEAQRTVLANSAQGLDVANANYEGAQVAVSELNGWTPTNPDAVPLTEVRDSFLASNENITMPVINAIVAAVTWTDEGTAPIADIRNAASQTVLPVMRTARNNITAGMTFTQTLAATIPAGTIAGVNGELRLYTFAQASGGTVTFDNATSNLNALENQVGGAARGRTDEEARRNNALIGAGVGAVALGLGGWGVSEAIIAGRDARMRAEQDEAVRAWLEAVGENIACRMNGRPVGRFGDWIDTSTGRTIEF